MCHYCIVSAHHGFKSVVQCMPVSSACSVKSYEDAEMLDACTQVTTHMIRGYVRFNIHSEILSHASHNHLAHSVYMQVQ